MNGAIVAGLLLPSDGRTCDVRRADPVHRLSALSLQLHARHGLIVVSALDVLVMALAWNEYRLFKRHLSTR